MLDTHPALGYTPGVSGCHFDDPKSRGIRQMNQRRRAVIDIGTNSVKLLVADLEAAAVVPVVECSEQTRLGRGFYESQRLSARAIADTARVVAGFAALARQQGAVAVRVIATSAAREARNAADFLHAVWEAGGLKPEIISGHQEADWVFLGVMSDARVGAQPVLILDVGGGSTEFIVGEARTPTFRQSLPLGSVRLFETSRLADPPGTTALAVCLGGLGEILAGRALPQLEAALRAFAPQPVHLVGTGGTAAILGAIELNLTQFDRERLEATRLSRAQVRGLTERLWALPLAARRVLPGLPPERADVILTGAAIYTAVMERFGFPELRISTRGLRFGALLTMRRHEP